MASRNFDTALALTLANEGVKFTDIATDLGGATKYGITQAVLNDYRKKKDPAAPATSKEDVKNLGFDEAAAIYKENYWAALLGDSIVEGNVAACLFDAAVNCGVGTVVRRTQAVLGAQLGAFGIQPDGIIGPKTIAALNRANPKRFIYYFACAQLEGYLAIVRANPKQREFFRGWSRRATAYLEMTV